MGRKLDALLGRRLRTSKLKAAINLAISRLALLKNHRHARFNIAHSDLIQLLRLNHHQQALLRVEQVIKDKNMLLVYDMIHDYCHLLKQRASLIDHAIDCPEELKEAVSSLLYATPRCGEFPELKEIRAILTARFGKELVDSTIESRSYSGVNQKMIQKLSSKELSLENKTMMLTRIAKEDGIDLQLEATVSLENAENEHNFRTVKSNLDTSESRSSPTSRYDYESDEEEIIEEDEDERSEDNTNEEEFDDLYSNDYSDDDNDIKSFEKMDFDGSEYTIEKEETGFPSRTAYFSSYKQFPLKHRTR